MQTAEALLEIIHERGRKGLRLERLYRHLFNPELYLRAYGKIYRNDGSLTPGADTETVDGMSLKKIQAIIEALRYERYRWTPVRRVYIEKKGTHGKRRPLGLPTWSDKLLQEVIRSILEAYYEPQFSDLSHGFRPGRGCHSALAEIDQSWGAVTWFVEGDVSQCFDRLDHGVLHSILAEDIHDNRFLRLIDGLLRAGYLEEWRYHETISGAPQGGIVTPPTHLATGLLVALRVSAGGRGVVGRCSLAKWDPMADCDLLGAAEDVFDEQSQDPLAVGDLGAFRVLAQLRQKSLEVGCEGEVEIAVGDLAVECVELAA